MPILRQQPAFRSPPAGAQMQSAVFFIGQHPFRARTYPDPPIQKGLTSGEESSAATTKSLCRQWAATGGYGKPQASMLLAPRLLAKLVALDPAGRRARQIVGNFEPPRPLVGRQRPGQSFARGRYRGRAVGAGRRNDRASLAPVCRHPLDQQALSARRRRSEAELDEKIEATVADPADDPEVALQEKNRDELLRRALTRLSREHREVVDLVYYHEKSVDEVAQILGVPPGTVKTRMFYDRKKLAELVDGG